MHVRFCGHMTLILLNIHLGMELLNHRANKFTIFRKSQAALFSETAAFHVLTSRVGDQFLCIFASGHFCLLVSASRVLMRNPLMPNDVE